MPVRKSLLFIFIFLFLAELASASHITIDERFENNNTDNISGIPSSYCGESNGTIFSQGLSTLGGCVYNGSYNGWNNGNITGNILNSNTNNVTCDFQMKVDDGGQAGNSNLMLFHGGSISVAGADAIPPEISWKLSLSGAQVRLYDGGWDDVDSFLDLGIYNDYTWNNVSIRFLQNASADVYINTTKYVGNLQSTPPINTRNWSFIKLTDVSSNARTWWDNITCYNGTSFNEPVIASTPTNTSPSIAINTPLNNTRRHNATLDINFTISTFSPNINISFFDVYLDYNSNPTSRINHSVNMTSGNFTITFTIVNVTGSSINNTYYLKINLTDNASNNVNTFIIFNLTNDITQYNVTNVSITPLPLSVNTLATFHFNLTNFANSQTSFPNQSDNISSSDIRIWVNNSILGRNITTLNAENVTLNANITFEVRINPGYGDTGWTAYVNSSTVTVGDTTAPTITAQAINGNSFTTDERINTTLNCTDNTLVNYARVEWNRTGVFANDTMSLLNPNQYSYSSLFAVGSYNITNFYCADGSNNIARDTSNFTFTVTSPPSGGGSSPAGGGGGGGEPETTILLVSQTLTCTSAGINYTISNIQSSGLFGYSLVTDYKNTKQKCRDIILTNSGTQNITINIECIDSGNLTVGFCRYVNLSEKKVSLLPNSLIKNVVKMCVLPLDENIGGDSFFFSIKTTDEKGLCTSQLDNRVETGGLNGFLAKFISFRRIGKLNYPMVLPALFSGIIIGLFFNILFRLLKLHALGILSGFLVGIASFVGYLIIF